MESRGQQRICERENKNFPRSTQMQTSSLAAMAASVGYGQQTIDSLVAMEALLDMSSPAVNAVQSMSQPPELQLPSSNATPMIASSTTGTVDKTSKVPFKNEQSMSAFATNNESLQGGQIVRPLAVLSSCVVPNKSESETVMNRTKKLRKMSESLTDDKIRKHEIEAALRSKSQRGRKRENLSVEERQELTRTRNREHAKTTRCELHFNVSCSLSKTYLLNLPCLSEFGRSSDMMSLSKLRKSISIVFESSLSLPLEEHASTTL